MSLITLRLNRAFRLASLLALWTMLFPALLPLLHPQAAVASAGMPICHMAMGGDQKPIPQPDKSQPSCPICWGLGALAQGYVPPDVAPIILAEITSDFIAPHHPSLLVFEALPSARPRAPPTLV